MTKSEITPVDTEKLVRDEAAVAEGFWRKLRRSLARIPFAEDLLAAYFCAIDRATPTYVRATLMGAVAYFVLPFDLVPDFLATLGFADDAAVLFAALKAIGDNLQPEHRERARAALRELAGKV
jgi:uncharacterized membrane protein YkvA (DUF1232 family)